MHTSLATHVRVEGSLERRLQGREARKDKDAAAQRPLRKD